MAGEPVSFDNAAIIQFSQEVFHMFQQEKSRLQGYVTMKPLVGESATINTMDQMKMQEIFGINTPISFTDPNLTRRKGTIRSFGCAVPIDPKTERRTNVDLLAETKSALVKAALREIDHVIYDALFSTVYTGKDLTTALTFANDGGVEIDMTAGYTYDNIVKSIKSFNKYEVGIDDNLKACHLMTEVEHAQAMAEAKLINRDYASNYVVENGRVRKAAGFDMVVFGSGVTDPMLLASGGYTYGAAIIQGAMTLYVTLPMNLRVEPRTDFYGPVQQVVAEMEVCCVRNTGKGIQKLKYTT